MKLGTSSRQSHKLEKKNKEKCSLYMDHIILEQSQFPVRELGYLWRGENREKSVLAFSYRKRFEQPLKCSGVHFMVFMKGWSMCLLLLYYCWGVETAHKRKTATTKESLPFSDVMLVPPSSLFNWGLLYFYFYSSCSSEWLVERCDSKEGSNCSSSCWVYYLHFNKGKEKAFLKGRPFVAHLQHVGSTQQSAVYCTVGPLHLSLTNCVITTWLTTLPIS